jgi:TonB family protein
MNRPIALLLLGLVAGLLIFSTARAHSVNKKRLPESKDTTYPIPGKEVVTSGKPGADSGRGSSRVAIPAVAFSKQRADELKEKVERATDAAIEVDNLSGCPLIISDARIKAGRGEADFPASLPKESGYAFKLDAKLSNKADRKIVNFALILAPPGTEHGVIVETGNLLIEPSATYSFGDRQNVYFSYFYSPPGEAILKVVHIEFEDGSRWSRPDLNPETQVDHDPIPLNEVQPKFTEEALRNRVEGAVIAQLQVGADGHVKKVKIVNGLPDGLDEMAIEAAYKLKFKPATKNGKPVAHWMTIPIKFELK